MVHKVSPVSLMALQMLVGLIVFSCIGFSTQLKQDIALISQSKHLFILIIACIISFNLGNFLIFMSIKASNATIAAILELSYPLFTILFTWLLFRINYISPGVIIGSIFIIIGVSLIFKYGQ
jgi:drug/metabolite transporter (DMT)-like permease